MKPGQTLEIPVRLRKETSIRNAACRLGTELGRRYTATANRQADTITVTRVS